MLQDSFHDSAILSIIAEATSRAPSIQFSFSDLRSPLESSWQQGAKVTQLILIKDWHQQKLSQKWIWEAEAIFKPWNTNLVEIQVDRV